MKQFLQHKKPQLTFAFLILIYFITQIGRI
jgi:hypothetical protein